MKAVGIVQQTGDPEKLIFFFCSILTLVHHVK